ncbi:unnamed protein product [Amaranthus hypochondriacus]
MEDFWCSSTRVGSEGGVVLSEALEGCVHLKKLDLCDNMFGVEARVVLSKDLLEYGNLVEAYLGFLNLEDEGKIAIADALKSSSPLLKGLELAGNDVTPAATTSLSACLSSKNHLLKLKLAENEFKHEGAIRIRKSLEGHTQLQEIDMN